MAEQGTHKPLVGSSNLPLGTTFYSEGFFIRYGGLYTKEITMFVLKAQDQGIIKLSQQEYLPILIESFLIEYLAKIATRFSISWERYRS